jgi:hypothetical protein
MIGPAARDILREVIMGIARVFPRRTRATPVDGLSFVGEPPMLFPPDVDAVHVSVSFTWDLPEAERLAEQWEQVAPVTIGGPATGMRGEDFEPCKYLRDGYVITSRGCRNRCWFCSVWRREGDVRELPIVSGHNVLDDNLLATSWKHFDAVCTMLDGQPEKIEFTGGLEAAILTERHAQRFAEMRKKIKTMFFAYDTPDDREPLAEAGKMLRRYGFKASAHVLRAYVLIGYPKDTIEKAETRLKECLAFGFFPMAMLYRDEVGRVDQSWKVFSANGLARISWPRKVPPYC